MTPAAPPTSAPPKSLLEAAIGRPVTQRGLDSSNNSATGSGGGGGGNNQSSRNSVNRQYEDEQQYQPGATGLSLDELV